MQEFSLFGELLFHPELPVLKTLLRSFVPHSLNTHPAEWSRAALGACLGILTSVLLSQQLFGIDVTLRLLGPLGASAVLLFAVSSGALAQPWAILGSYLISALVGLLCIYVFGHGITAIAMAIFVAILIMCVCRCLHPPAAGIAFSVITSSQSFPGPDWHVLLPIMFNGVCLVVTALIYNNLTRMRYPRAQANATSAPPTEPSASHFNSADIDKALDDVGTFVDVSREDLEAILHKTEAHAQHRNRTDIDTAQIIERSTQGVSLGHSVADVMKMLGGQGRKYLPVLDEERKVIGVISLID